MEDIHILLGRIEDLLTDVLWNDDFVAEVRSNMEDWDFEYDEDSGYWIKDGKRYLLKMPEPCVDIQEITEEAMKGTVQ